MAATQPKAGLRVGGKEDAEAELKEAQDAFEAAVRADAEGESQTAAGSAEGAQNSKGHSLAGGGLARRRCTTRTEGCKTWVRSERGHK